MKHRTRVAVVAVMLLAAGCTPTTVNSTPSSTASSDSPSTAASSTTATPTSTPTSTWNSSQAAAVAAVRGYTRVSSEIGADPANYSKAQMRKAFSKYIGPKMIDANVGSFMTLKKNGYKRTGRLEILSISASKPSDSSRGVQVYVTVCQDQRALKIVDKSGLVVATEQAKTPPFNLRQYSVRKLATADRWLVFGMQTVKGECGE